MRDRRSERRHRVLKAGKVLLKDGAAVDCTVRDISTRGAHIEFDGPVCLPDDFQLRFIGAEMTVRASAVWQRRLEAGIVFARPVQADPLDRLLERIAPAT